MSIQRTVSLPVHDPIAQTVTTTTTIINTMSEKQFAGLNTSIQSTAKVNDAYAAAAAAIAATLNVSQQQPAQPAQSQISAP